MQLNALFCCLWHNVEASSHKHSVVFSLNQLRRLLPCVTTCVAVEVIDNTWPVAALTAGSEARYRLRIAISAYPTCIRCPCSRRSIAMTFGTDKLEWCDYPAVKKIKICLFVLTQWTNVTDTHTQTDTAWRLRPRLHSIARQKAFDCTCPTGVAALCRWRFLISNHIIYNNSRCLPCDAMHKRGLCRLVVSVCPSVYPSRSWILSKRVIASSKCFHRLV